MPKRYLLSCDNNDLKSNEKYADTSGEADIKIDNHITRTKELGRDCNGKVRWEEISPLKKIQLFFNDIMTRVGLGRN